MSKSKTIIITGVNGQLGQFMAKYLQDTQPELQIIGTIRHKSYDGQKYIFDRSTVTFELMELSDVHSIENLIIKYKPDYFVNTAANAFVGDSWKVPTQHIEQNCLGVLHQLEAIRSHSKNTRYFNMGTSEEFGSRETNSLQDENTRLDPKSPYGCSKAAARHLINVYRSSYGIYAIQNHTFNFESELRGNMYVTKKITQGVARIKQALDRNQSTEPIELGNLNSTRSWQFAGDVADSIWRSLNQDQYNPNLKVKYPTSPQDLTELSKEIKSYVVSAPECHSIRELVELAFDSVNIKGIWRGEGVHEVFVSENNTILVKINPKYFRPLDVTFLNGDARLITAELGWQPTLSFKELVKRMVNFDIRQLIF